MERRKRSRSEIFESGDMYEYFVLKGRLGESEGRVCRIIFFYFLEKDVYVLFFGFWECYFIWDVNVEVEVLMIRCEKGLICFCCF